MSTLHTVNKSPFSHTTLLSCLEVCGDNDGILLIEDGVFGAVTSAPTTQQLKVAMARGITVYALSGDIKARGLSAKLTPAIQITDYDGFVQLSIKYRCVQSWY